MKQIITTAAILILAISFTSCRKGYVCNCTVTYQNGQNHTQQHYITYSNKGEAQAQCDKEAGYDGLYTTTCSLEVRN